MTKGQVHKLPYLLAVVYFVVALVGLPPSFLEEATEMAHSATSYLGINITITPFTYDMWMVVNPSGSEGLYRIPMVIRVKTVSGQTHSIDPKKLNLYKHKVPLLLYFEAKRYSTDIRESKHAICFSLGDLVGESLTRFLLTTDAVVENYNYEDWQNCENTQI